MQTHTRKARRIKEDKHFCKYYDAIYILFHTGLRISENEMPMVALHWEKYFQHIREKFDDALEEMKKLYQVMLKNVYKHIIAEVQRI